MMDTNKTASASREVRSHVVRRGPTAGQKLSYLGRWLPTYAWQRFTRHRPAGKTHLIFALADHFEPGIVPEDGLARAPYPEQERRLERWCREYPIRFGSYLDVDGRPFVHSYFYPAEQYDQRLIARLADHCRAGWGEIEIHLHHGVLAPDSAENTRRQLFDFRDRLAGEHGCLSMGTILPNRATLLFTEILRWRIPIMVAIVESTTRCRSWRKPDAMPT